ncbi:UNVERIFIED_CONTAM: hypothetical protein RMT77_007948 [Armadillidium vulgare]
MEDISVSGSLNIGSSTSGKERERRKRKNQHCIYCQNHKEFVVKKEHICPYRDCDCILCDLLREAQKTMRQQQKIWRFHKNRVKQLYGTKSAFISVS